MRILNAVRCSGFTLVELAVTLVIVTLVLGSILVPLVAQVERRQISDTQKTLEETKEALVGYAVANGNLPCPDINNDGIEDFQVGTGKCSSIVAGIAAGNLPWVTLGIANADAWGNRFRYVMNALYAQRLPNAAPFTIGTPGNDVRVCTTAACAATLSTTAVAAVISHGKNGYGAMNSITNLLNPAPAAADELENTNADANVVSRVQTSVNTTAGEFDDILTWLSRYTLFNRMVAAGKLP